MQDTIVLEDKKFKKYITQETISKAVAELGAKINSEYQGHKPIFVVVLNGAFIFAADLLKNVNTECEIAFVKLTSYQNTRSTGTVKEELSLKLDINNRDIVIIEDIIDTGLTLEYYIEGLFKSKPKSVKIATLLLKPDSFKSKYPVDYVGMEIPNDFIVGYGLDYNGIGRNYPDIYKIIE